VVGSCGRDNKPLGSVKDGKFLGQLSYCLLRKELVNYILSELPSSSECYTPSSEPFRI
jgi:hypothetical protein